VPYRGHAGYTRRREDTQTPLYEDIVSKNTYSKSFHSNLCPTGTTEIDNCGSLPRDEESSIREWVAEADHDAEMNNAAEPDCVRSFSVPRG